MQTFAFYLFYAFIWVLMWLPLPVVRLLSRVLYRINIHFINYRKSTIIRNLSKSFPQKSKEEIIGIYKKFYRHFFNMFVESFYTLHMGTKEAQYRLSSSNIELVNELTKQGKDITMVIGHYGNWEWLGVLQESMLAKNMFIYQKLQNPHFDWFWKKMRTKYGALAYPTNEVLRQLVSFTRSQERHIILTLADQCPIWENINRWTTFLNQPTGWNTGFVRISQKFNHAIVFADIQLVKQGIYDVRFELLSNDTASQSVEEIHDLYINKLEQVIQDRPELWLWSHKRWKRQPKK